jgi:hypothetical protein
VATVSSKAEVDAMNTRKFGPVALSITLVSLLATMAGCAHEGPAAVTPATASHPVVDFAVAADVSRQADRSARFETNPIWTTGMTLSGGAKR